MKNRKRKHLFFSWSSLFFFFFFFLEVRGGVDDFSGDSGGGSGLVTVAVLPLKALKRKHGFHVLPSPFSACHLVFKEILKSKAFQAPASLAYVFICLPPLPDLPLPP